MTDRFALICASHTPLLMQTRYADSETCARVNAAFDEMKRFVEAFAPDRIVQFSPDHYHGFHYDMMPSFCIGTAAMSYGDWGTAMGPLNVDEAFALGMLDAVRAANVDAALSYAMTVDHGFVQMWEAMFGRFDHLPIVPVFVNAIAHPLPRYERARLLGEACGRYAAATGRRVLFAASGGLSHDPIVPRISGAEPVVRDRLIGRAPLEAKQQAARERSVHAAAQEAMHGKGPSRPLNPRWDENFLDMLVRRDWAATDALTAEGVDHAAGGGANEVLAWVAAAAAMEAAGGAYRVTQRDYAPIPGWIAGMAHLTAVPA